MSWGLLQLTLSKMHGVYVLSWSDSLKIKKNGRKRRGRCSECPIIIIIIIIIIISSK
jgi:hypothetical protein